MSLPYFPMYPSDYEAKTSHLTIAEDGAYFRLLRLCWMTAGCSLPDDDAWIMRRARAFSDDEKQAVKAVLDEFFTLKNGRWINERLAQEFKDAENKYEKRKMAGRKGGSVKYLKSNDKEPSNAKAMLKQCLSNQNQNQNQNQTIKYNREKIDIFDLGDGLQIGQQTIDAINEGKRFLLTHISPEVARRAVNSGLVSEEKCKKMGVI